MSIKQVSDLQNDGCVICQRFLDSTFVEHHIDIVLKIPTTYGNPLKGVLSLDLTTPDWEITHVAVRRSHSAWESILHEIASEMAFHADAWLRPSKDLSPATLKIWDFHLQTRPDVEREELTGPFHADAWECEKYRYRKSPIVIPQMVATGQWQEYWQQTHGLLVPFATTNI